MAQVSPFLIQITKDNFQKPGDYPNFKKKNSRSEKAILGALGEFRGILGAALGVQKTILGMRNPFSEWPLSAKVKRGCQNGDGQNSVVFCRNWS